MFKQPDGTQFGHLFGFGADLERVEILYTSLLMQAVRGLQNARTNRGDNIKAFRRTWLIGFAEAVYERQTTAEHDAAAATTNSSPAANSEQSVALVLADRSTLVRKAFRAKYPRTRSTTRRLQGTGRQSGRGAGMRANLGTSGRDLTQQASRGQLG